MTIFSKKSQSSVNIPFVPAKLRVQLNFQRGGAAAISLMALNCFTSVALPIDFTTENLATQRAILARIMRKHHHTYSGKMPYQAEIIAYTLESGSNSLNPQLFADCRELSRHICNK